MIEAGERRPLQAMLVEQDQGPTVIVAVPMKFEKESTAAAGSSLGARTAANLVKSSLGTLISIGFHRVERRSLATEAARGTTY
eukprot:9723702-Heterocapsa_arctica.AAC.1